MQRLQVAETALEAALCALAVLLTLAIGASARGRAAAFLATMGFGRARLRRVAVIETLPLLVLITAGGVGTGILVLPVLAGSIDLPTLTGLTTQLRVRADLVAVGVAALAVPGVALAAVLGEGLLRRRSGWWGCSGPGIGSGSWGLKVSLNALNSRPLAAVAARGPVYVRPSARCCATSSRASSPYAVANRSRKWPRDRSYSCGPTVSITSVASMQPICAARSMLTPQDRPARNPARKPSPTPVGSARTSSLGGRRPQGLSVSSEPSAPGEVIRTPSAPSVVTRTVTRRWISSASQPVFCSMSGGLVLVAEQVARRRR